MVIQKPLDAASRIPRVTSWARISVIQSRQKNSGTRGRSTLELVDYDGLLLAPPKFEPI